ncbi:MAG: ATP-dependent Clp protease proteolytic subunit [Candidatus Eisenbacteria bacterium]|jgi:ATP-dependent Clp protease protease subunit|nr:ATP-dependent Clp protease proteolytic subunit [Candidatus Eisenbacteria bacterium]
MDGGCDDGHTRVYDRIEEEFLRTRRVFLWGAVDDELSEEVIRRLLYLESLDATSPITLLLNSPGGAITSGFAIYDTMRGIAPPVHTVCLGLAASFGAVLLAAGEKGHRCAWPHARILIHQPLIPGQVIGAASDLEIQAKEMLRMRERLNEVLAHHSGQSLERIRQDTDRDFYMSAEEAQGYGLIDQVMNYGKRAL